MKRPVEAKPKLPSHVIFILTYLLMSSMSAVASPDVCAVQNVAARRRLKSEYAVPEPSDFLFVIDEHTDLDQKDCSRRNRREYIDGWHRVPLHIGNVDMNQVTSAFLLLPVYDVDENAKNPEVNEIFFNDKKLGVLKGDDKKTHLNTFELDLNDINLNGDNLIEIKIDIHNIVGWCVKVEWIAVRFETSEETSEDTTPRAVAVCPGDGEYNDLVTVAEFESKSETACDVQASLSDESDGFITSYSKRQIVPSNTVYGEAVMKFSGKDIHDSANEGPFKVGGVIIICDNGAQYIEKELLTTPPYQSGNFYLPQEVTLQPTTHPTPSPTKDPTESPTTTPTSSPTRDPTRSPTTEPTSSPVIDPTGSPTTMPSPNELMVLTSPVCTAQNMPARRRLEHENIQHPRPTDTLWVVYEHSDLDIKECGNDHPEGEDSWLEIDLYIGDVDMSQVTSAFLVLPVWDVDLAARRPEINEIFFNKVKLGHLKGANDMTHVNTFEIDLGTIILNGNNLIEIHADILDNNWCVIVDWLAVEFESNEDISRHETAVCAGDGNCDDLVFTVAFESEIETTCQVQASLHLDDESDEFITSYKSRQIIPSDSMYGVAVITFSGQEIYKKNKEGSFKVIGVLITCENGSQFYKINMDTTVTYTPQDFCMDGLVL